MLLFAASISTSILYAAPAVAIILCRWLLAARAQRLVKRASKIATDVASTTALAEYLKVRALTDVSFVKGENYRKNEYVPEKKEIQLSPDVFACVDLGSIAIVLRVGAQAESARRSPMELPTIAKLGSATTILFWCVFAVLGAGVMTLNLPATIIGYVIFAVMILLGAKKNSAIKRIDDDARQFVMTTKLFDASTAEKLARTIDALRTAGE